MAQVSWPSVVAAKDTAVAQSGVPKILADDLFMRDLVLGILGGELSRALVRVTQFAPIRMLFALSCCQVLKICTIWMSLDGVIDWVLCCCVIQSGLCFVLFSVDGRRTSSLLIWRHISPLCWSVMHVLTIFLWS